MATEWPSHSALVYQPLDDRLHRSPSVTASSNGYRLSLSIYFVITNVHENEGQNLKKELVKKKKEKRERSKQVAVGKRTIHLIK